MLETVGQFGLRYSEQTQGTLGSLVATPSLNCKEIRRCRMKLTIGRK